MVRFLLDEHVPRVFEHLLEQRSHEVDRAKDHFGERTVDPELLAWCADNAVVFVTNNAQDFERLHEAHHHHGLFIYRKQGLLATDPEGVARTVDTVLSQYGEDGLADELVELDEWYAWLHG